MLIYQYFEARAKMRQTQGLSLIFTEDKYKSEIMTKRTHHVESDTCGCYLSYDLHNCNAWA